MNKKVFLAVLAAALAALLALAFALGKKNDKIENAGQALNAVEKVTALTYGGETRNLKKHVQTVLLMGTDDTEAFSEPENGITPFYNYHQADFLMLLAVDKDARKVSILQLNRDTMADVPWLDVLGKMGGTEYQQICLAFNSGSGGRDSCLNVTKTVSELLFDLPVDYYMQIPMTAIGTINDLVGGVPVTIEDDFSAVDPSLALGQTIKLNGRQAETFIRSRQAMADSTNLARMRRHRQYMDSFQVCAREAINTDSAFVMRVIETMSDFLQSDMTADQIAELITVLDTFEISPITPLPGELTRPGVYYEYILDTDGTWEALTAAVCE